MKQADHYSYSTSSLGPWHRTMGYIGVTSLVGSAITACAARYFYHYLTGTPQYVLRTYKFTKILSGLLLATGAASTIQSYCIDSFKQMAECKFALWNIQSKKLPFDEVKRLHRTLINLHSFQKEYIPLLLADLKATEDYPAFIEFQGEKFVRYLKETGNGKLIEEKKEAYKARIENRLKNTLGAVPNDPFKHLLVLSQHASYGKEFLGTYFETTLTKTLKDISWHACFKENGMGRSKELSTLFQKNLISVENKALLKNKFIDGLRSISTNIIETKKLYSHFRELGIIDKDLYIAATNMSRGQWMSGSLTYLQLRAQNDLSLVHFLNVNEIARLKQEMQTWSYKNLIDYQYLLERGTCNIDVPAIIQTSTDDYLPFREFHGIDALTCASDIQKERFKINLQTALAKGSKYTEYKVDCEKLGIDPRDIFLLKQWGTKGYFTIIEEEGNSDIFFEAIQKGHIQAQDFRYSTLETLKQYLDQPIVLCEMMHTHFKLFSSKVFSPNDYLSENITLNGLIQQWTGAGDEELQKSAKDLQSALATSSYKTLEEECKACGVDRGKILRSRWQGKGYFQICLEENGPKLFWDAIQKKEVSRDYYILTTLEEIRTALRSIMKRKPVLGFIDASTTQFWQDPVYRYEIYINRLVKEHSMLFTEGIICRDDEIALKLTIGQFFYNHGIVSLEQLAKICNQTLLEALEKRYEASIWSTRLLHADDPIMQYWITYEIRAMIAFNIPRDRYQVCLKNKLVSKESSAFLTQYDHQVTEKVQENKTSIQALEKACTKAKEDAMSSHKSVLADEERKLDPLKENLDASQDKLKKATRELNALETACNIIAATIAADTKTLQEQKAQVTLIEAKIDGSSQMRPILELENGRLTGKINEYKGELSQFEASQREQPQLQAQLNQIEQLEKEIQVKQQLLKALPERNSKIKELTTKLEKLQEEEKQLSTVVTGVEAAKALQNQQKQFSTQILATTTELEKLKSLKDPSIEETEVALNSMCQDALSLGDGTKQRNQLKQIRELPLDLIKSAIQESEATFENNKKTLLELDRLPSRLSCIQQSIPPLEQKLQALEKEKIQKTQELNGLKEYREKRSSRVDQAKEAYQQAQANYDKFKKQQDENYDKACEALNNTLAEQKQDQQNAYKESLDILRGSYIQRLDEYLNQLHNTAFTRRRLI